VPQWIHDDKTKSDVDVEFSCKPTWTCRIYWRFKSFFQEDVTQVDKESEDATVRINLFDIISYRPKFGPFARLALKGRASLILPRLGAEIVNRRRGLIASQKKFKKLIYIYIYIYISSHVRLNFS